MEMEDYIGRDVPYCTVFNVMPGGVSSLGNCASADTALRITNVDRLVERGPIEPTHQ